MQQIDSSFNTMTNNSSYTAASALQVRLDTTSLIENVEMFLRGTVLVLERDEQSGQLLQRRVQSGRPRANDRGVQSILSWLQLIINTAVVQGNFPTDAPGHSTIYENFIYNARLDLTKTVLINCMNWEMADEDLEMIIDSIMNVVEPYMTRLIDNKERESYDQTVRHIEHNNIEPQKSGIRLLG